MSTMTNAQPGWYPDPAGDTGKLRYWDGTQWTDHLAEPQPARAAQRAAPMIAIESPDIIIFLRYL